MSETQGERIASLEVEVRGQNQEIAELKNSIDKMDSKLDELLALRNKGLGVFWLASTLVGTGLIGFLYSFFNWKL